MGIELRLTNARISFASGLWTPSAAVENGTKKYNCDFIVSKDTKVERRNEEGQWVKTSLTEAQKLCRMEAFKGDAKKADTWFEGLDARQKSVRDGNKMTMKDSGEVRPGYEDTLYVHATSKTRMPVFRGDRTEVESESESPVFSGCYVVARVQLYCNLKTGQKGLFAALQGTQFYKTGDALGGGRSASAGDFDEVAEGSEAEDFS